MNNNNFTVMAFTKAKPYKENYSTIATSTIITLDEVNSKFYPRSDLLEKLNTVYKHALNIVVVSENFEVFKMFKLNDDLSSNIAMTLIPFKEFFIEKRVVDIFVNNNINQMIFMFNNMEYRSVAAELAYHGIIVSGGSNTKKHMLSPIQLRLARFIIGLDGLFHGRDLSESFHQYPHQPNFDFTDRSTREEMEKIKEKYKSISYTYEKNKYNEESKTGEDSSTITSVKQSAQASSPFGIKGQKRSYHFTPMFKSLVKQPLY